MTQVHWGCAIMFEGHLAHSRLGRLAARSSPGTWARSSSGWTRCTRALVQRSSACSSDCLIRLWAWTGSSCTGVSGCACFCSCVECHGKQPGCWSTMLRRVPRHPVPHSWLLHGCRYIALLFKPYLKELGNGYVCVDSPLYTCMLKVMTLAPWRGLT